MALLAQASHASSEIAVLISAHEINPLLPVMDRIVYLAAGRAAAGAPRRSSARMCSASCTASHVDVLDVHGRVLIVAGAGEDTDLKGHEGAFPGAVIQS